MKILVITQAVDRNNTVLGFFHEWIIQFAKKAELVNVICLEKGDFDLPANVKVMSLGKENLRSRFSYILNFYKYIWNTRKEYDLVFVHMNQEYVLLGSLIWKILGKKIFMWRNHPKGSFLTRVAVFLSNTVFCTSTSSYTAQFSKTEIMPVGVDTNLFKTSEAIPRYNNSLLMLGRIAPVKNNILAFDVLLKLRDRGVEAKLDFVGGHLYKDQDYYFNLVDSAKRFENNAVTFRKGVPFNETASIYNSHTIFLNFTEIGSFDKTIIEALACGQLVVTTNQSLQKVLPQGSVVNANIDEICDRIQEFFILSPEKMAKYKAEAVNIVSDQSLVQLADKLFEQFNACK